MVPLVLLGLGTGILSGLLGISGASLLVPSLVGFFLIDHHAAQGIAMSVALADSAAGAATHARAGNVRFRVVMYMAGPAVVGAAAGAFLSDSLSQAALRYLFVTFMVAIWGILLARMASEFTAARSIGAPGPGRADPGDARGAPMAHRIPMAGGIPIEGDTSEEAAASGSEEEKKW